VKNEEPLNIIFIEACSPFILMLSIYEDGTVLPKGGRGSILRHANNTKQKRTGSEENGSMEEKGREE
jgi:hypothetical protein